MSSPMKWIAAPWWLKLHWGGSFSLNAAYRRTGFFLIGFLPKQQLLNNVLHCLVKNTFLLYQYRRIRQKAIQSLSLFLMVFCFSLLSSQGDAGSSAAGIKVRAKLTLVVRVHRCCHLSRAHIALPSFAEQATPTDNHTNTHWLHPILWTCTMNCYSAVLRSMMSIKCTFTITKWHL